jgi:hypothetical protein
MGVAVDEVVDVLTRVVYRLMPTARAVVVIG